jgi:hypothetical protein
MMSKFTKLLRHRLRHSRAGQSIILLALGMIGLLAFVGLVTDVSLLFVRFSQLRRAVDAASIAAAGQVRENRDYADVALTARQFIRLHGLDPERVLVQTCVTQNGTDPELCVTPPRKLVRVIAQIDSPTTFLSLLGWGTITLETSAVSETAALDVALVLDTSESMSEPTDVTHYNAVGVNPARAECIGNYNWAGCCNDPGTNGVVSLTGVITGITGNGADGNYSDLICQPFKQVRDAARAFVQRLDFTRGDRVVFVTFDRVGREIVPDDPSGTGTLSPLITSESVAVQTLDEKIGVNVNVNGTWGACSAFASATPWSYEFIAPCNDTNIGGGILKANEMLTNPLYVRRTAVWVMIVLSDGAANVTNRAVRGVDEVSEGEYGYHGYCPWWTFCDPPPGNTNPVGGDLDPSCTTTDTGNDPPWCSDSNPYSRHFCMSADGRIDIDDPNCDVEFYDATDFAMDAADFSGLVEVQPGVDGNFIAMYSIGFGTPSTPISQLGEVTLRYIADAGDNGRIDNNVFQECRIDGECGDEPLAQYNPEGPCESAAYTADCGQYWYADNPDDLDRVFTEIASRLFTRLAR